ncbi:MAG: 1-deoxy-D-xylulose-5-phosphate synthase, partial [Muribaculaceae bacterium]|nr:1-deoxy-D-xylulose-5-phosphate synthase [Muribaculaceae bacterium]
GILPDWKNEMHALEIGKGECLKQGTDVAFLTIGTIGTNVTKAIQTLESHGINAAHYNMLFLKPIDKDILSEVCANYPLIVTVEDGTTTGGLGSIVANWIATHSYSTRLLTLGVPDRFIKQGTVAQLQTICGIDPQSIAQKVLTTIKKMNS